MITSKFIKAEGYKILFAMAITVLYYIILGLLSVIPDEPLVPYAMSVIGVAVGIASSGSFMFFCRKCQALSDAPLMFQVISSFIYGISSYLFIGSGDIGILLIYLYFPVFFILMEENNRDLLVIMSIAVMAIVEPHAILSIVVTSCVVMAFVYKAEGEKDALYHMVRLWINGLIGLMLGAFRIISTYVDNRIMEMGYPGFLITVYPIVISVILFMGILSATFLNRNKRDVYYVAALIIVFLARTFSPVSYLLSLGAYNAGETKGYDILFLFFLVFIFVRGMSRLAECSVKVRALVSLASIFPVLLIFVMQRPFSSDGITKFMTLVAVFLAVVIPMVLCGLGSKKLFGVLLIVLIMTEVMANTLIVPGEQSIFDGAYFVKDVTEAFEEASNCINPHIDPTGYMTVNDDGKAESYSDNGYKDFYLNHYDTDISYINNYLFKYADLSLDEKKEYDVLTGDKFELFNAMCKKVGINHDVFKPIDDCKVKFESTVDYRLDEVADGLYSIEFTASKDKRYTEDHYIIPFTAVSNQKVEGDIFYYNEDDNLFFRLDSGDLNGEETLYLRLLPRENVELNFRLPFYYVDGNDLDTVKEILPSFNEKQRNSRIYKADIFGILISALAILIILMLFFPINGKTGFSKLQEAEEKIAFSRIVSSIGNHLYINRYYYLAFLIPFLIYIVNLLVYNCLPFGINSIFDSDGAQSILPCYYEYASGGNNENFFYSLKAGYGYGKLMPSYASVVMMLLKGISIKSIMILIDISEGLLIGASGFTMAYYLTHRLVFEKTEKNNIIILFSALLYSCNYYFAGMHAYNEWYVNMALFPLTILGFERLIKERKPVLYMITLMLSVNAIQLVMYESIFIVIWFFFMEFDGVKDFFMKIARAAVVSLLSLLPGIVYVYSAIGGTVDSNYRDDDAIFPAFGFHRSFLDQWKSFMIFSPAEAVNRDDGGLVAYAGMIIPVLLFIFLISKKFDFRKKLRLLIPVFFLLLSFNGQVLSFLWNGFHYQSSVPNRYAFLLMFLLAIVAYEGLSVLHMLKKRTVICSFGVITFIFLACILFGREKAEFPVAASFVVLSAWLILYFVCVHFHFEFNWKKVFVLLYSVELLVASVFAWSSFTTGEIVAFGNVDDERAVIEEIFSGSEGISRVSFPNSCMMAGGMVYNVPSIAHFSPYITKHQTEMGYMYGYLSGTNWTMDRTDATPFSNSLGAVRFILLPKYTNDVPRDLNEYDYVGETERFFIYENPDYLSLGVYMPLNIGTSIEKYYNTPEFYNEIVKRCIGEDKNLFRIGAVGTEEYGGLEFADINGNPMSSEEAEEFFESKSDEEVLGNYPGLRMRIDYKPHISGNMYLYNMELVSLGYGKKEENSRIEICFPNRIKFDNKFNIAVMDEDVYGEFIEKEKKRQLSGVVFKNDSISGTADYEEDGYTMFSLGYDPNFKAYIDGKETEIEDLFGSVMFVKTPKGKHTIELRYRPTGLITAMWISAAALIMDMILLCAYALRERRKLL